MSGQKKAVLLLSGGLDSCTVLEIMKSQGYEVHALSFSYGQRHTLELQAVRRILERSPVKEHKVIPIDLRAFGGSALTSEIEVPKEGVVPNSFGPGLVTSQSGAQSEQQIPVTYVPARNTIFLSLALGFAEVIGAYDIFLGVNAVDYSNYPDCRPEFIECFEKLANLATAAGVESRGRFKIHTPLIHMSKAEIIKTGLALGVDYSITTSCYDPSSGGDACGRCEACMLRQKGFSENRLADPVKYQQKIS